MANKRFTSSSGTKTLAVLRSKGVGRSSAFTGAVDFTPTNTNTNNESFCFFHTLTSLCLSLLQFQITGKFIDKVSTRFAGFGENAFGFGLRELWRVWILGRGAEQKIRREIVHVAQFLQLLSRLPLSSLCLFFFL